MKRAWGNGTDQLLIALKEYGPCTVQDLCCHVDISAATIRKTLKRMGQIVGRGPGLGKRRAHITGWVRDADGEREYPRPVWGYGHGTHAKRPDPKTHLQVQTERYYRLKRRVNSVFNLGA